MDNELYDYRKYDQIWKRVNPQENPYPQARNGIAPRQDGDAVTLDLRFKKPNTVPPVYQTLLREELRHMQEVLRVLENALA